MIIHHLSLVIGDSLLVNHSVDARLVGTLYLSLVSGHSLLVIPWWSLGYWSRVYWSLVYLSLVIGYSLLVIR